MQSVGKRLVVVKFIRVFLCLDKNYSGTQIKTKMDNLSLSRFSIP